MKLWSGQKVAIQCCLAARRTISTRIGNLADDAKRLGDGPTLLLVGAVYEGIVAASVPLDAGLRCMA